MVDQTFDQAMTHRGAGRPDSRGNIRRVAQQADRAFGDHFRSRTVTGIAIALDDRTNLLAVRRNRNEQQIVLVEIRRDLSIDLAVHEHVVMKQAVEPQIAESALLLREVKLPLPIGTKTFVRPAGADDPVPEVVEMPSIGDVGEIQVKVHAQPRDPRRSESMPLSMPRVIEASE